EKQAEAQEEEGRRRARRGRAAVLVPATSEGHPRAQQQGFSAHDAGAVAGPQRNEDGAVGLADVQRDAAQARRRRGRRVAGQRGPAQRGGADMSTDWWWDRSWNPAGGCKPVSPGCTNCYAAAWAAQHKWRWRGVVTPHRDVMKRVGERAV